MKSQLLFFAIALLSMQSFGQQSSGKLKSAEKKFAKLKFEIALDNELIKEIVKLCGGNPNKAQYLWNSS